MTDIRRVGRKRNQAEFAAGAKLVVSSLESPVITMSGVPLSAPSEEGTWTPVFEAGVFTDAFTGVTVYGYYQKIGPKVTITATIRWTGKSGTAAPGDFISIAGLPHLIVDPDKTSAPCLMTGVTANPPNPWMFPYFAGRVAPTPSFATTTPFTYSEMASGAGQLYFTMIYFIPS